MLIEKGETSAGIESLKNMVELYPDFALAYNDLGVLHYQLGDTENALQYYNKAIEYEPNNTIYNKNLGDFLFYDRGEIKAAIKHYIKVLEISPDDSETLTSMGHICIKMKDFDNAIVFFEQAVGGQEANHKALEQLSHLLKKIINGVDRSKRIVFISHNLPCFDKSATDNRIHHLLNQLSRDNYSILFLYAQITNIDINEKDTYVNRYSANVRFIQIPWRIEDYKKIINAHDPQSVWMTNLWNVEYVDFLKSLTKRLKKENNRRIIIDTQDFHHKSNLRRYETSSRPEDLQRANNFMALERELYPIADYVVTVSNKEQTDIQHSIPNSAPIEIVSIIHEVSGRKIHPIDNRQHICFLANCKIDQSKDAVIHFITNIFPKILDIHPDTQFHVAGNGSDELSLQFNHPNVRFLGYVEDLFLFHQKYRLFVCPMIYGSGVKGKVISALADGLPVVTTSIGAEGIPIVDGTHGMISDDKFAIRCCELIEKDDVWYRLSENGQALISKNYSIHSYISTLHLLLHTPNSNIPYKKGQDESPVATAGRRLSPVVKYPLVSIIIPTFNRSDMLGEALNSALNQNYKNYEIIIVDDGSNDGTSKAVKNFISPQVHYIRNNHEGVAQARNSGIQVAKGDYILWLDDDDLLFPNTIESHMSIVKKYPQVDVVYGNLEKFKGNSGEYLGVFEPEDWYDKTSQLLSKMSTGCPIPNPGTMIKRSAYEKYGEYDPSFRRAGDYEFWSRTAEELVMKKNPDIVCRYRIHGERLSGDRFIDYSFESVIIRKMVEKYGFKRLYPWLSWEQKQQLAYQNALIILAESLIGFQDYFNALRVLETIPIDKSKSEALVLRVKNNLFLGNIQEVDRLLDWIVDEAGGDDHDEDLRRYVGNYKRLTGHLSKAVDDMDGEKVSHMIAQLEKHKVPLTSEIAETMGRYYQKRGDLEGAFNVIAAAVRMNPEDKHLIALADDFNVDKNRKNQLFSARERLLKTIVFDIDVLSKTVFKDNNKRAWEGLPNGSMRHNPLQGERPEHLDEIKTLCHQGWIDEAYKRYSALVEQEENSPKDSLIFANLFLECSAPEYSLKVLDRDFTQPLEEAHTWIITGRCYEQSGALDRALELANKAAKIIPKDASLNDLYGIIAYREGNKQRAADFFQKAIQCDLKYGPAYTHLGTVKWEDGNKNEALDFFEKGFLFTPTVAGIAGDYFNTVSDLKAEDRALPLLIETCTKYPNHRQLHFFLVDLYLKSGKVKAAMEAIEDLIIKFGYDQELLVAALSVRKEVGPHDGKDKIPQSQKISLCMIVKDEAAHLAKCIKSARAAVDEIIVVDTGSTDSSHDIATIFGAKVYNHDWTENFSIARNESLKHASCGWIFVLDGDEVISAKDVPIIRAKIREATGEKTAFSIETRNYTQLANMIGWVANDGSFPHEEMGTGWYPSKKVRLFPNDPRIRFEFPIHETVGYVLQKKGYRNIFLEVPVHHYGKLESKKNIAKGKTYYSIGKRKLEKLGNNIIALSEMAVQAGELEHYTDAVELWEKVLKISPADVKALLNITSVLIKMGKFSVARKYAMKAFKVAPEMNETVFNLGFLDLHNNEVKKARKAFMSLIKKNYNYYSARFMASAALICENNYDAGYETLQPLKKTPQWDYLRYTFDELRKSLKAAGQIQLDASLAIFIEKYQLKTKEAIAL